MGCCSKALLKKKIWSRQEDNLLINYINKHGPGRWRDLPQKAGLKRCGKSCRFRWLNYLRPDIKRGSISPEEEDLIMRLHRLLGNRWSLIAGRLPGRTDNEIKNLWNTRLKKRVLPHDDSSKVVRPKAVRCIRAINIPYPEYHYIPQNHEAVLKKRRVEDDNQLTRVMDDDHNEISAEYWVDILMGLEQDGSCSKVVDVPNSPDPQNHQNIFVGEHLSTHDGRVLKSLGGLCDHNQEAGNCGVFGDEAYGANMVDIDAPHLDFWRDENDDNLNDSVLEAMDLSALLSSFLN